MSAIARIGGFAIALAVIFAAAALAGAKLDPSVDEPEPGHAAGSEPMAEHESSGGDDAHAGAAADLPGLSVAEAGYRLVPDTTSVGSAPRADYAFRILGPDGETVRDFEVEHERRMHLIVVRRDFEGFQHLHPEQLPDGSWTVELDARLAGTHRVFADFATAGRSLTLGTDLFVPGDFDPEPLPAVASTDAAGDGYEVEIEAPGDDAGRVRFTITRDGRELRSVEPYLGADGHLVALREHDQAFLHTHPEGKPGGRGPISFQVEYPSAGRYRLFLQFKHAGDVRTAAFTREVAQSGAVAEEDSDEAH